MFSCGPPWRIVTSTLNAGSERLIEPAMDGIGDLIPDKGQFRSRFPHPAKKSGQNIPKNRCRTTIAERLMSPHPSCGDCPLTGSEPSKVFAN